jgi:hypothetical protein
MFIQKQKVKNKKMPNYELPPPSSFRSPTDIGPPPPRIGDHPTAYSADIPPRPPSRRSYSTDIPRPDTGRPSSSYEDNSFDDQPIPIAGQDFHITVEPTDNLARRAATRVANHYVDVTEGAKEKGPGRMRRVGKALAQTVLPALMAISAIIGVGAARSESQVPEQRTETSTPANAPEKTPEKPKSALEQKYQESKVEVQDHPFTAKDLIPEQVRTKYEALNKQRAQLELDQSKSWGSKTSKEDGERITKQLQEVRGEIKSIDDQYSPELAAEHRDKTIDALLEKHQAEFKVAAKLSSGIRVNIYGSKLDSPSEPLDIDPRALDVMMNELIDRAATVEGNPAHNEIKELQAKAAKGELNMKLSLMMVSDERLCIAGKLTEDGNAIERGSDQLINPKEEKVLKCQAAGLNYRTSGSKVNGKVISSPDYNQFVMALDSGPGRPTEVYSPEAKKRNITLDPDQQAAVVASHEIAHALFGATNMNGQLSGEDEHTKFVFPVQSKMYEYYCDLKGNKDVKIQQATPFHVDTPESTENRLRLQVGEPPLQKPN